MAAGSIQGDTFDLKKLFGDARYDIEPYQREYAWSAEDVRTLVRDLFDAFERDWQPSRARRSNNREPFFLGPFVYVEQTREERFLVDGQQRFTTLHLLFLHLRQAAHAWNDSAVVRKLEGVITDFSPGHGLTFRIDIKERQAALEALYRSQPYEPPLGSSLSVRNLHERSVQIGELVEERLEADRCVHFVDWLLTEVVMVGIRAPSRDSGFRIFESMNDRGARLTSVDLLKSFLLSNVQRGEELLNERWRHMLAELTNVRGDADAPRRFLKAALIAHYATVGEEDATDSEEIDAGLNNWVRKNSGRLGLVRPEEFFGFMEDLIRLAKHYRTFLQASRRPYDGNGLEALYYNGVNGLTNHLVLVLAAVQPQDMDTPAKEKAALVANFLDRLYVDRALHDEPAQAKDFEPDIHRLIPQLRKCSTKHDVSAVLAAAWPSTGFETVATFGMRGNNKAQVRYLLARLTEYAETGCGGAKRITEYLGEDRTWQIEHLYANHPSRHAEMDGPTFRALRARLGVLVLLPSRDNASYNDLPLEKKRTSYARQNILAAILSPGFRTNHPNLKDFVAKNGVDRSFREFGSRDPMRNVAEIRGELYRKLCERIWAPEALGFPAPPQEQPSADPASTAPGRIRRALTPRRRRLQTDLAKMVRASVLAPGTQLEGNHRGNRYTGTVDEDGGITLPSGDYFANPDEAGKMVCGTRSCSGLGFWHVATEDGERQSLRQIRDQAQQDGRLARTGRA